LELGVKVALNDPPRAFAVGLGQVIQLHDCASIHLEPDEQVTFRTESGGEYDVCRKDWGFYATPSLNGRLLRFGLRGVLVKNRKGQYFVLLVEAGKEASFHEYLDVEKLVIVSWLDGDAELGRLEARGEAA
jgi:hypothetical protein